MQKICAFWSTFHMDLGNMPIKAYKPLYDIYLSV